jgi:hypothetical protein
VASLLVLPLTPVPNFCITLPTKPARWDLRLITQNFKIDSRSYLQRVQQVAVPYSPQPTRTEHLAFLSFGGFSEVVAALLFVPLNVLTSRLQIQGVDKSKALYPYKHGRGMFYFLLSLPRRCCAQCVEN